MGKFNSECCPLPATHMNAVHWQEAGLLNKCVEGKAWYDKNTGALVRVNKLDGTDVTDTVPAANLKEGECPDLCELVNPVGVIATWG